MVMTKCNWTHTQNYMQIRLKLALRGDMLIQEGMYLTVSVISCMSSLLKNLFRCLKLSFDQQNKLTELLIALKHFAAP